MSNEEIYEILKDIKKDLSDAINKKADKEDVNKSQAIIWKVLFSLFGVNMFGIVALIVTVITK